MLGFNRWHLLAVVTAILCIGGLGWLALDYFVPSAPSKFTIATGVVGQTNHSIGEKYRDILARSHVTVDLRETNGSVENLTLLNDPASGVKVGIMQGGISNAGQSPDLLSLGRIGYQYFWIFYRAPAALDDPKELKGKRIALGLEGSGSRIVAERILGISGITAQNTTLLALTTEEAVQALNGGTIDAVFGVLFPDSPVLASLMSNPNVRLMSFARAEALTRIFPFLVRLVLPQGAFDFEHNLPATDVTIIATTLDVLTRKEIHPAAIDLLAQAIVTVHGGSGLFQRAGDFPMATDPEYPVAQNAIDFYRNGPSVLNRYLPFWMTSYVQRFLVVLTTIGAIAIPLFSFGPTAYEGLVRFRLNQIYRDLRAIDVRLEHDVAAAEMTALESQLDSIGRAILLLKVPMQYSELYFNTKTHLDFVRENIGLRRAKLQS